MQLLEKEEEIKQSSLRVDGGTRACFRELSIAEMIAFSSPICFRERAWQTHNYY